MTDPRQPRWADDPPLGQLPNGEMNWIDDETDPPDERVFSGGQEVEPDDEEADDAS